MEIKFDFNLHKYALMKFDYNWADEFDIESLAVFTGDELNEFIEKIKNNMPNLLNTELYFGTNEYIMFESENDIWDSMKIIAVNEDFYRQFKQHIGKNFGTFSLDRLGE